jgi:periplasmic mercuric ion binding protein
MKKAIQLTLLVFFAGIGSVWAQQKATGKAVISIPQAQCDSCKSRIELFVARQYGVTGITVNVKKKNATVTWITDRTDIEQIKTHIANCGFDADDVTADERAYKRLPQCCKKQPETPAKQ